MADTDRLFLAVPLSEPVRRAIVAHLEQVLAEPLPGRAVPTDNWHLTLRFLGDTPRAAADRLRAQLAGAALGAPFTLRFGRPGAFPSVGRARVVWLGVGPGTAALTDLAAAVERHVVEAGFDAATRPFHAHLTLARLRPKQDVRSLLDGVPPAEIELPVREVVLYRSHLGPSGASYEALDRFALGPP